MPTLPPEQKSRLLRVLTVGGLFAVLLGIYVAYFAGGGRGLPCPLLLLTGLKCPACGMTRAVAALLNPDFSAALSLNALWPLFIGYILWVVISDARMYVRRGEFQLLPGRRWVHGVMLAVVIAYGILRNLV